MLHMRFRLALATLFFFALSSCAFSAPDRRERILDFHSDITLEPDGTFLVRETITVNATGSRIRHGIFRDFPTRYKDRFGNNYVVGFALISAEYDGYAETSRVQDTLTGKRIYLGDQKLFIPSGQHTYVISYTTNRQLGFFPDHDEMYWNVTGNAWLFSIDHASATVTLPANISNDDVKLDGFTGPLHSFARNLTHQRQPDGTYFFETTRPLGELEGLSIVLSWPKGLIAPPTTQQQLNYFFSDNRTALLSLLGLLILSLYYLLVWYAVGRDPARGVIMPLYEPPANLSPAATRFLVRMGFDNKTFAAAILDMAVRGFLTIKEQAGSYTLYRTKADLRVLTPDEKQLASVLFDGRDQLWLHNENHTLIQAGIKTLKSWLKLAEEKVYFFTNKRFFVFGVIFSVIMVLAVAAQQSPLSLFGVAFLSFWLSIWSFACAGLALGCGSAWKAAFTAPSSGTLLAGKAIFLTLVSLPFFAGEVMGIIFLVKFSSIFIAFFFFASVALHIAFHYLLKAPTVAGRRLMDQVDGFKLFLGAVDGDRLNRIMPPDKTPQTFEKFLPYALALDLEQAWSQKFAAELGFAGQAPADGASGSAYTPSFYSGSNWNGFATSGFTGGFAGAFTDAVSSSSSAPGSSDGSSGGSGGGGGGGGGGGW
jgi:uncharacterized membrane protein YgcG